MSATLFCSSCGSEIDANARFCTSCGADQQQFAAKRAEEGAGPQSPPAGGEPPPPGQPAAPPPGEGEPREARGQFAKRVESFEPGAADFAAQLTAGFQAPGVVTALLGGLLGALGCFAVGLLMAAAFPDDSLIGVLGTDVAFVTEAFGQTVGLLLAQFPEEGAAVSGGTRVTPVLLVAVPIAACAIATATQAEGTRGLAPRIRLAWASAVGLPFGLLMLIAAVASGDLDASVGGAFLLGLLWGALGGALGMFFAMRRDAPETLEGVFPSQVRSAAALVSPALKALLAALAIAAIIGTSVWWVQSIRDQDLARYDRSLVVSLVESTLYAGEHGVNYTALGAGVQFETDLALPVPLDFPDDIAFGSELRLFDLGKDMQAYLFVPLLILLMAVPALLALYAGFATARVAGSSRPEIAAAWGALVGPVWAIAMAVLQGMHVNVLGDPNGDSVFGLFLLGGAVLGALGGLLATQGGQQAAPQAPIQAASRPYE